MKGQAAMYQCDGCGHLKLSDDIKAVTVTGVEGDFCHACRHGKNCDCNAGQS